MTDLSTLPSRMRYAATVIEEAAYRNIPDRSTYSASQSAWSATHLRDVADLWEEEDRVAAERDALVEELAEALQGALTSSVNAVSWKQLGEHTSWNWVKEARRKEARFLIDAGWSKSCP